MSHLFSALGTAALVCGIAACSSGHSAQHVGATAGSSSAAASVSTPRVVAGNPSATLPPPFTGTQHALPSGTATANVPALYQAVVLTGCAAAAGGWHGVGTAKNTTAKDITFSVLVLFTDAQARDVDSATAKITVAPGETGTWDASRKFTAPAGVTCVVRSVSGG